MKKVSNKKHKSLDAIKNIESKTKEQSKKKTEDIQLDHPIVSYQKLVGNETLLERIIELYQQNRLAHSIIITGPGQGKSLLATKLASKMFDQQQAMFDKLQHPDMLFISDTYNIYSINEKKNNKLISVDEITQSADFLQLTPSLANNKLLLIDGTDNLNLNGSNALLKLIEEPPHGSYIIIVTNNLYKIPQTIKSRCAIFSLAPLSLEEFKMAIDANNDKLKVQPDDIKIKALYELTDGNITQSIMALNYGLGESIMIWYNDPTIITLRTIAMEFMFFDNLLCSDIEISKQDHGKLMTMNRILLQMWQKSFIKFKTIDHTSEIDQIVESYTKTQLRLGQITKYHLEIRAASLNIILSILRIATLA